MAEAGGGSEAARDVRTRWRHLLLATDGSGSAARAADVVACVANVTGARVTVAAVAAEHGMPVVPWQPEPTFRSVPIDRAAEWVEPDAARLRDQGIEVEELVLEGDPVDALIEAAQAMQVDLLVVGHHGADAGPLPPEGSVTKELSRRCPCPLLIVP
jgi:nucleotide-binding universal stress UspA family protein